jgi:hypothetical protein
MAKDPLVGYYKGKFLGKPVYFFRWSAVEYIFMRPQDWPRYTGNLSLPSIASDWRTWAVAGAVGFGLVALAAIASAPRLPAWRRTMVSCARQHVKNRTPYEWGGGHHAGSWGLDCSGLLIDCGKAAGLDLRGWDSRRMNRELPKVQVPQPGDAIFYAPRHVVMVESYDPKTGLATIIGANGGNSTTTSLAVAKAQDARVKREPTHLYRYGFQGFLSLAALAPKDGT